MKLAITDACIFIDLFELQLTAQFFELDIEIHTSLDVFNELYEDQKQLLSAFRSVKKLTIHIIEEKDRMSIYQTAYPRALSDMDKTVLFLAAKFDAIVLSSDKAVRNYAKNKAIEYHGMLWIFDKLVELGRIEPNEASLKLNVLINRNTIYQNNAELVKEMGKRLKLWGNMGKS